MDKFPHPQKKKIFHVSVFFIIELMDGMRDPIWAT